MSNASASYVPVSQSCERALSDLAFGIRSVERVPNATPAEIKRLDCLLNALSDQINRLEGVRK